MVDDEPLILSGIKFLIDWEKNDCILAGTARNGMQALELIEEIRPDIIIADISMPIMSGMELLQAIQAQYPALVVIMLTNLEEFNLAREAIHMRAVDYLTKYTLDAKALENSLAIATKEAAIRRGQFFTEAAEHYRQENRLSLLTAAAEHFFSGNKPVPAETAILAEHGILRGWSCLRIWFLPIEAALRPDYRDTEPPSRSCTGGPAGDQRPDRLDTNPQSSFWIREIVENLAANSFTHYLLLPDLKTRQGLLMLHWGGSVLENRKKVTEFTKRLASVSENMANLRAFVLFTDLFEKEEKRADCLKQLHDLETLFYLREIPFAGYDEIPAGPGQYHSLGLTGIPRRMETELAGLSVTGCNELFDKVITRTKETLHEKEEAVWLAEALWETVCSFWGEKENDPDAVSRGYREIKSLLTRGQLVCWLEQLKDRVLDHLKPLAEHRSDLVARAKEFVRDNLDRRISLNDAAAHAGVSAGYLSSLFKKQEGQNFIDYVNGKKIRRACELIREGGLRFNEISYMLGYENAYYFSKVFRRCVGMTPSEYQNSISK